DPSHSSRSTAMPCRNNTQSIIPRLSGLSGLSRFSVYSGSSVVFILSGCPDLPNNLNKQDNPNQPDEPDKPEQPNKPDRPDRPAHLLHPIGFTTHQKRFTPYPIISSRGYSHQIAYTHIAQQIRRL